MCENIAFALSVCCTAQCKNNVKESAVKKYTNYVVLVEDASM